MRAQTSTVVNNGNLHKSEGSYTTFRLLEGEHRHKSLRGEETFFLNTTAHEPWLARSTALSFAILS